MKMLELKHPGGTVWEYHILQPGEVFPGFGGSRHGLLVKKTASLVVRERGAHGLRDVEYAINNPKAWHTLRYALANPKDGWTISEEDQKLLKHEE